VTLPRTVGPDDRTYPVVCMPSGREILVSEGSSLMEAVSGMLLPLAHACGGMGMCGFCRVTILEGAGHLSPIGEAEARVLGSIQAREGERLACFAKIYGAVALTTTYW